MSTTKSAEQMPNDEAHLESGKIQVHTDPAGREAGAISAPWGEKPPVDKDGYPNHFGTGAVTESNEGRREMLNRLFDELGISATADKAFVNQHFATPEGERRTPHSPLLQKQAAAQELRSIPTLKEKVRGIIGG